MKIVDDKIVKLKYRYHYEDHEGKMLFRYDNAPHHMEVETFPHHKHTADGNVVASSEPTLQEILFEIITLIR